MIFQKCYNLQIQIKIIVSMSKKLVAALLTILLPIYSFANEVVSTHLNATSSTLAIIAVVIFCFAYILVVTEDITHLNKSKPVVLAAGIIWILVALVGNATNSSSIVSANFDHVMIEYGELLLFLIVAMAYINLMEDRNVFEKLKSNRFQ